MRHYFPVFAMLGGVLMLVLVGIGLFWWQGRAAVEKAAPPPTLQPELPAPDALPIVDPGELKGPAPPEATELIREEQRFFRYDRNRDRRVTRNEMLSTRSAAFRKLDKDGNNLLDFEEWDCFLEGGKVLGMQRATEGTFALPKSFTLTFEAEAVSDPAYLLDYGISDKDRLLRWVESQLQQRQRHEDERLAYVAATRARRRAHRVPVRRRPAHPGPAPAGASCQPPGVVSARSPLRKFT